MPKSGDPMDHNAMRRYVSQLGLFGLGALLASPRVMAAPSAPATAPSKTHPDSTTPPDSAAPTKVVILLFPGTTMLDWIGPYELLHRVPGIDLVLAAKTRDPYRSDSGMVIYQANALIQDIDKADVLLIPGGGMGVRDVSNDADVMGWIRRIDRTSRITASVCTGALILGRAGLLRGRRATTHWALQNMLNDQGATYVDERWVVSDKYWTSAGVSAGLDMTLALIGHLRGDAEAMKAQLKIQYDPKPPFHAGAWSTAPAAIREAVGAPMPSHG
ncbi:DJ-1/PfpI family protein [Xanthomonas sacchari]|uniref:DJ-1/PfpI family protein n=1 Tax=Xanthomonas sacchari TaxID=56458 RepID=UPI003526F253